MRNSDTINEANPVTSIINNSEVSTRNYEKRKNTLILNKQGILQFVPQRHTWAPQRNKQNAPIFQKDYNPKPLDTTTLLSSWLFQKPETPSLYQWVSVCGDWVSLNFEVRLKHSAWQRWRKRKRRGAEKERVKRRHEQAKWCINYQCQWTWKDGRFQVQITGNQQQQMVVVKRTLFFSHPSHLTL